MPRGSARGGSNNSTNSNEPTALNTTAPPTSAQMGNSAAEDNDEVIVLFRTSFRNLVHEVCRRRPGWQETDSDKDWDVNWADIGWVRDFFDHVQMEGHQRINHFPNHYELTRKDLLVKNLKRMRRQLERESNGGGGGGGGQEAADRFDFFPATFVLPSEYGLFLEDFKQRSKAVAVGNNNTNNSSNSNGNTWIMKPIGKAQGKGIFLFNKLSQISDWKKDHKWKADGPQAETYVAQRYVDRPYTIGGKKFDLRLFALVTSFTPLTVWVHRSGFCRFSSERYDEVGQDNISNTYMHLTNYSIQKKLSGGDVEMDFKWDVHSLKLMLVARHGQVAIEQMFDEIQELVVNSLLAVQKSIIQDKHCFELYGYDVLIDADLKPWLIEVNASPSLSASSDEDRKVKKHLLSDVLNVLDLEGNSSGQETRVGGFDLVHDGNVPVTTKSGIGCQFDASSSTSTTAFS